MRNFKKLTKREVRLKHTRNIKIADIKEETINIIKRYLKPTEVLKALIKNIRSTPVTEHKRHRNWNRIFRGKKPILKLVFTNCDSIKDFKLKHGSSMTNYENHQYRSGKWNGESLDELKQIRISNRAA